MSDSTIDLIARVCHETNRSIQAFNGEEISPSYDYAPDWQKESAIEGVRKALAGNNAEELHASWCDFKVETGWRYGPVKDDVAKTHPCLVAYEDLPEVQKLKDYIFAAVVRGFKESGQVIA
jgi:hypothetical protein